MSKLAWILSELGARLWVRAALYGVIAVATALAAIYLKYLIPEDWPRKIGADAVDGILNIMAASMLSVTIFSLSTMVSAYSSATSNVTPRATKLLIEDRISHVALSTFIGAFIFSMVGIVALKTGVYGDAGRVILFAATIGVNIMVVVTLLRWIEYLLRLGRVHETIGQVERATTAALTLRLRHPYLGGRPLEDVPANAAALYAQKVGYVQYVDMGRLSSLAEAHELDVYVVAPPGKFVDETLVLVHLSKTVDDETQNDIRGAFVINDERTFRQDPRYGLAVLCEVGQRALSPAVNDPGTAIYLIGASVRIFSLWAKRDSLAAASAPPDYPRIAVPPLRISDMLDDFYPGIARDGAALVEVHIRLQKAYGALYRLGDADLGAAVKVHAQQSMERALAAIELDADKEKLAAVAAAQVD